MVELGGECDFVTDVAMHYPLYVILSLLGLPEDDFPRMLKLTQELFGTVDPELGRGTEGDDLMATLLEFFEYFQALIEDRRAHPRDDLASVIANAEIDGEPIGILEAVGYYVIIATAGHDTTSSAIAVASHALLEHPDQLQRLRDDPALVPTAVEEMIRWVSPVKQFMRTATERLRAARRHDPGGRVGAALVPVGEPRRGRLRTSRAVRRRPRSEPPRRLRIRRPLLPRHPPGARMEARALYNELIPRLRSIELAGEPAYMETLFVGGPKHLPIRYQLD